MADGTSSGDHAPKGRLRLSGNAIQLLQQLSAGGPVAGAALPDLAVEALRRHFAEAAGEGPADGQVPPGADAAGSAP